MIWVVRDFDQKQLMPYVSVWSERPVRRPFGDGGFVWLSASGDVRTWIGSLWLPDAVRLFGVVPDDETQVIVMERAPAYVRRKIDQLNGFKVPKP